MIYWTIEQWMVTELGLTGAGLHAFAIIYGYSREGAGTFYGSRARLAEYCGITVRGLSKVLAQLEDAGYIKKIDGYHAGTQCYDYVATVSQGVNKVPTQGVNKVHGRGEQSSSEGVNKVPTGGVLPPAPPSIMIDKLNNRDSDTETGAPARACASTDGKPHFLSLCPFGEEEIKELWGILLQQPKWRKKGANAIQQAAKMLGNVTAKTAFYMLQACIAGEWQGLHYPRPDELRTIESESFEREIEATRARIAARKAREAAERQKEGQQL